MDYFEKIMANGKGTQEAIEQLILQAHGQSVGSGYYEVIVPMESALPFLSKLTEISIVAVQVSWWCRCDDENKEKYGCPHGMGGPFNEFGSGYYSEMGIGFWWLSDEFLENVKKNPSKSNAKEVNFAIEQFIKEIEQHEHYSPCLTPAFSLWVPEHWERE